MRNKQSRKHGFTLIELLVVVLIIGILAGIALPPYQKAVWKSRSVQLLTVARSLATAQEANHLANGEYATSFSELDIDFSSLEPRTANTFGFSVASTDAVRGNDWMGIYISYGPLGAFVSSATTFITGHYKGEGFLFSHHSSLLERKIYRKENVNLIATPGAFCT